MTDTVRYAAAFPVALADDAGRRFTRYVYRRMFGGKMALFLAVDVVGCVLAVASAGWTPSTIALCSVIAAAGGYFIGNWFMRPRITSRRLRRAFGAGATVTLRPGGFELEVGPDKLVRPWGRQRAILESDEYFLLVIAPVICRVLPREGMPAQGEAWVRAAMNGPMSSSRLPGF